MTFITDLTPRKTKPMRTLEYLVKRIPDTKCIPDIFAIFSGGFVGFCSAKGAYLPGLVKGGLELAPTATQTLAGGLPFFFNYPTGYEKFSALKRSTIGFVLGATETAIGYCIGYTLGSLTK
ncbi:hypothetical protein JW756_00320 [Candidatus Woesearchaeota archaeon]|nr:hypothetical protein [Candidatus Woesearchaeota archaeon]